MKSIEEIFEGLLDDDFDVSFDNVPSKDELKGREKTVDDWYMTITDLVGGDNLKIAEAYTDLEKIIPTLEHVVDTLNSIHSRVMFKSQSQLHSNAKDLLSFVAKNKPKDLNKIYDKAIKNAPAARDVVRINNDLAKMGCLECVYIDILGKDDHIDLYIMETFNDGIHVPRPTTNDESIAVENYLTKTKFNGLKLDNVKDAVHPDRVGWTKSFSFRI